MIVKFDISQLKSEHALSP